MNFKEYHFHIYFNINELEQVNAMVQELKAFDDLSIGRIWNKPVGPHPIGSCQVLVQSKDFHKMTDWFMLNRNGLSIFVHALSGDDIIDHTEHVMWIGPSVELNLDFFQS